MYLNVLAKSGASVGYSLMPSDISIATVLSKGLLGWNRTAKKESAYRAAGPIDGQHAGDWR